MLASLMMLAFLIDQIQQLSGGLFGLIWKKLGTKAKLWAMMRSLFSILVFDSMKALQGSAPMNFSANKLSVV